MGRAEQTGGASGRSSKKYSKRNRRCMNTSLKENLLTIPRVANAIKTCGYLIVFVQILYSFNFLCSHTNIVYMYLKCSSFLMQKQEAVVRLKTLNRFHTEIMCCSLHSTRALWHQFSKSFQCLTSFAKRQQCAPHHSSPTHSPST